MNFIQELRHFFGMQKDWSASNVPPDKYIDAENIRLSDQAAPFIGGLTLTTGNEYELNLGFETSSYKGYRIAIDLTANSIYHSFIINGITYTVSTGTGTPTARYNTFKTNLEAATVAINGSIYIVNTISTSVIHVGFSFTGGDWTLTETITAVPQIVYIIHEFFDNTEHGAFVVIKTYNLGDNLFILKTNGSILAFDCAIKNESTGIWTQNTFFKTKSIHYALTQINLIDLEYELDFGEQCSFYYSGTPPRVTYVKGSQLFVADSSFIWNENPAYIETGNPYGYYTYENVEEKTRLQVLENFATANFVSMQDGGALSTGDKMYLVRQKIGTNTNTGFNICSNPINVMSQSLSDTTIHGNTGGYPTSKSITLRIDNLNPALYDHFDLAVIENIDGVLTPKLVKSYSITGISQTITHYGTEISTNLTVADIVTQQIVIYSAGNCVINRDRLFLSDIQLKQDTDFSAFFDSSNGNVSIGTGQTTLPAIGKEFDNIGEYQLPQNVNGTVGYTLHETYRLGAIVIEKNGFVNSPCFMKDWTCYYNAASENLLTDADSVGVPQNIFVYYPQVTIDYTNAPDIDGKPFLDNVYAISIVRQECIPEVYSGYLLPQTDSAYIGFTNYAVGKGVITNTAISGSGVSRQYFSFICPDILMGQRVLNVKPGDYLINSGQPKVYNRRGETRVDGIHVDYNYLIEFNGRSDTNVNLLNINYQADHVNFNSIGVVPINNIGFLNTTIDFSTNHFPCATSQGIGLGSVGASAPNTANPITTNTDLGFYHVYYISPLTNKYGDKKGGAYFSCGHFETAPANGLVMNVFGGDTFTQKNFFKLSNFAPYLVNDYIRTGMSFYTQNRGNYQMRDFINAIFDNLDFPYTTFSLVQWLSGVSTGSAQLNQGQLNYSQSYTPVNTLQTFQGYDNTLPVNANQPSSIYYSDIKIEGSPSDTYRIFLPLNTKSYTQYGRITNTFKDVNALYILCEQANLFQQLDQQQQQTDPNGSDIIIGNGTVLGSREVVSSYFGSPLKTAALKYLTKTGSWFIIWYNPYQKKVYRRGGDGVRVLTEENFIQTFMAANNQYISAENDIIFGWDSWTQEILMRAKGVIPTYTDWASSTPYTKGDIVRVGQLIGNGGTSMYRYFQAKINVPDTITSPLIISNQLNYWEIYRNSNYLIAFDEHDKINDYTSFYGYTCNGFIPYKNTFLTNIIVDANIDQPPVSGLFEHNKNTLKYYAYDVDTPYGINISGYVSLMFNKEHNIFKTLRNIWIRAQDSILTDIHFFGQNGTKTFSIQSEIVEIRPNEDAWWSNVKQDATIGVPVIPSGTNTTGSSDLLTQDIGGQTNEVRVFFTNNDNTKIANINKIELNGLPKPKLYTM